MPGNAYAVILTELGKSHVEGGIGFLPEMSQFTDSTVMEASFESAKIRLQSLINQQKALKEKMKAAGVDFKSIQNTYAKTDSITIDELIQKLQPKLDQANNDKEKYAIYSKELNKVINAYKAAITKASRVIAALKMQSTDQEDFIDRIKKYLITLKESQQEISKTEKLYYQTIAEIEEHTRNAILYEEDLQSLVAQYVSGGAYKIEIIEDKKADNEYKKRVKVSTIKGQGGKTEIARTISRYLNNILKRSKGNIQKLKNQKFTSAKSSKNKKSVASLLNNAINQISALLNSKIKDEKVLQKHNIGRETMTDIINQLGDALENNLKEIDVVASLGGTDASKIGDLTEKYHALLPSREQIIEENITKEDYIQTLSVGKLTRKILVPVPMKEEKRASYRMRMNEIQRKMPEFRELELSDEMDSTMRNLKDFQEMPEYDKVDNIIKVRGKNDGQDYYIAISDKFKGAHFLQNVVTLGSATQNGMEINPTNLASSFDMLNGMNDNLTNQLIFTMLNMSTASILRDEKTANELENLLSNIAATYFFEFSFNPINILKNIELEFPEFSNPIMSENTLYVFNLGPLFTSVYEVLEGLSEQFNNKNLIEDVVKVIAQYDTAHSSLPLWFASLRAEPINKSARWEWVANQVAANTKIGMAFNVQALLTALG